MKVFKNCPVEKCSTKICTRERIKKPYPLLDCKTGWNTINHTIFRNLKFNKINKLNLTLRDEYVDVAEELTTI